VYTEINEKLELVRQGIARLNKIHSMISQLEAELGPLEQKECELKKALEKENLDVEKLENRSFSSVLYSILGSLEKHIEKENAEALAAKLKYDQALRDVEDIEHKISALLEECSKYVNCQSEYDRTCFLSGDGCLYRLFEYREDHDDSNGSRDSRNKCSL